MSFRDGDQVSRGGTPPFTFHYTSKNDLAALRCLGIFMMTDLAWQLANLVYVPYCSSDAHMGDSDHEVVNIIFIIV